MAARADNLHSRLVAVLKVLLPLVALALLSTLFLISRRVNPEDAIPYADVDVADRLRDPKMTDAGFAGVTGDGDQITLSAGEARPSSEGGGALAEVLGKITTPEGLNTAVAAVKIATDATAKMIELSGGTEVQAPDGTTISAQGLGISTDRTLLESRGAVTAQSNLGQLSADQMRLSRQTAESPYLLVFNGHVRLIYLPPR